MLGRLMISLEGTSLSSEEEEFLANENVGGVILFTRNYESLPQLKALTKSIKTIHPELLIAVDHEGGRVWRFTQGFTTIPPMKTLGDTFNTNPEQALDNAYGYGATIARELRSCGIDFSFTPVLDIDYAHSIVIGDRAFSNDAKIISKLANKLMHGLKAGGMINVGKHFPGHGYAKADSHLALPVDTRTLSQMQKDILPYQLLYNELDAIMTAHILYPEFDEHIATFSQKWLTYLREDIGFKGIIFSDDLSMMGAKIIPDVCSRIHTAIIAGCDMILLCNDIESIKQALQSDYPKHHSLHTLQGSNP